MLFTWVPFVCYAQTQRRCTIQIFVVSFSTNLMRLKCRKECLLACGQFKFDAVEQTSQKPCRRWLNPVDWAPSLRTSTALYAWHTHTHLSIDWAVHLSATACVRRTMHAAAVIGRPPRCCSQCIRAARNRMNKHLRKSVLLPIRRGIEFIEISCTNLCIQIIALLE